MNSSLQDCPQQAMPRWRYAAGVLLGLAMGASVWAQGAGNWPDRPIKVVVPYTPGGGTDAVTRHLTDKLTQETKWAFVVDNRPGGNGNIGLDVVAKSRADGYTLGVGQTANLAINPAAMPKMPFDPTKDLIPVALIAELPTILVVHTSSPWNQLAQLISAAKGKPETLRQALAGSGTVGHLAGEMLSKKAGIKLLNVPYKGAAPAVTDLMGGHTDLMFATPQSVIGLIKSGKLKALAVTSSKRLSILPNVPTVAESGYANFEATDWKVLVAPRGTPEEVIRKLNAAVNKAVTNPTLLAQLEAEGSSPLAGSPEKVARYIQSEQAEWAAIVKSANIKLD